MNILLIEDSPMIIKALTFLLKEHNFIIDVATSIKDAKKYIEKEYELIILDLMLPDGDGLDFFKNYLKDKKVLVLSAKDLEDQIVDALDSGVEDYITKPFKSKELLSRIQKIIKRNKKEEIIEYENIKIYPDSLRIYTNNIEIYLTALELKILMLLIENANHIVTREIIIERIWDISGKFVNDNTLTVYIKRIREKLNNETFIKTIKGIGYRIDL